MNRRVSAPATQHADQAQTGLEEAIQRLASVLIEENAALRVMDFGRAGALLTSKWAAADALESLARMTDAGRPAAELLDKLASLVEENQMLHHRSLRLQRRVHTLVTRLAVRSTGRPALETAVSA